MERYEMADGRAALLISTYGRNPSTVALVDRDGKTEFNFFVGTYSECRRFIDLEKKKARNRQKQNKRLAKFDEMLYYILAGKNRQAR